MHVQAVSRREIRRLLGIPAGWFIDPWQRVGDLYLARAARSPSEYFHVRSDGTPAYEERYDFVGPFVYVGNDRYLAVAILGDTQFHITPDGKPAYRERYRRIREVMELRTSRSTMCDFRPVGRKFLAIAADDSGMLHIKPNGKPAYTERFHYVGHFHHRFFEHCMIHGDPIRLAAEAIELKKLGPNGVVTDRRRMFINTNGHELWKYPWDQP